MSLADEVAPGADGLTTLRALRAEGRVVGFGRRAAFAEASLTDASGRVYATATSTLLVFPR